MVGTVPGVVVDDPRYGGSPSLERLVTILEWEVTVLGMIDDYSGSGFDYPWLVGAHP